eukprot:TRINITY_DN4421_c0_g1_i1.p2 TRINITY_DN4421_c0_g1~~TRINITY_DN4421_c0_g1_i1.p2  ORF type:complete len:429 (-),score=126.65 TRINITY_DN4421_c0_g1_i1:1983-3269(-)
MTVHAVYILDRKGKIIITRNYRGDLPNNIPQRFVTKALMEEEELNVKPVIEDHGISFIYIRHNDLYIVAVTDKNTDVTMILQFLYNLVELFKTYFETLEEESIRDNFVITYELFDEVMDFGYPQITDPKILKEYITQEGHQLTKREVMVPRAVTGVTPRGNEKISYRKNEVFLDVIESINLLASSDGRILRSEITGSVKMRVYLSGMPELRLGLNDRVQFESSGRTLEKGKGIEMEDVTFHQCVKLSRFTDDRVITFVPPDGEFELMNYRLNTNVKPLIWVESIIETYKNSRIEYQIKARSQFKQRSTANNVQISIPVPKNAATPKLKASFGSVKYAPEKDALIWTIKQFEGGKEHLMRAHFALSNMYGEEETPAGKPPITISFEIPYFTVSGIQVRYLKIIEKSGYQAQPWVRYITQSGDYQIKQKM